jgi:hypothetical protein
METQAARQPQPGTGKVVAGVIVMIVGLSLLVDRLDWDVRLSGHFWPLILIVIGIARLADRSAACGARRSVRSGLWLVYVGLWGLINEFHLFGLNYGTSWPLLVIGAGVGMVWRALDEPRPRTHRQER